MQSRIHSLKLALRILGAAVNLSFALMACWLLIHPIHASFYSFTEWMGHSASGLLLGMIGCYWEFKGHRPKRWMKVKKEDTHPLLHTAEGYVRHAFFVLSISFYYFWLGCYVMGGVQLCGEAIDEIHMNVGHVTGIMAWAVAAGDLAASWLHDREQDELDEGADEFATFAEAKAAPRSAVPAARKLDDEESSRGTYDEESTGADHTGYTDRTSMVTNVPYSATAPSSYSATSNREGEVDNPFSKPLSDRHDAAEQPDDEFSYSGEEFGQQAAVEEDDAVSNPFSEPSSWKGAGTPVKAGSNEAPSESGMSIDKCPAMVRQTLKPCLPCLGAIDAATF